jgi:chorismate synthase
MPEYEATLAHLAVEYWKLMRTVERAIDVVPEHAKERLASQARYAASRLEALLGEQNMSLQGFEGMEFEVNLPAVAINGEEFQDAASVVERTLEPAVISNMRVLLMGKAFLARKE